jgi:hypothetical protein
MTELVHFVKQDNTERTSTSTTAAEVTQYTIAWSDLTTAGFAASDDIVIIVAAKVRNSNTNNYVKFQIGFGTTYAGRADVTDSFTTLEPIANTADRGHQYLWMDRRTLVTSENIYFSLWVNATTGTSDGFTCLIFKLGTGGLGANDFGYAEATHSGNAPASYDTAGASFSTPAAGDWLLVGMTRWLIDSTSASSYTAISAGGSDYSEIQGVGGDTADELCVGTLAYRAGLGSGQTCRTRYKASSLNDCVATKIFGIRLDAFQDHWGAHTTNTITHSVAATYQEFAGNGSYSKSTTGNMLALALPIHTTNENTKRPVGRIQLANADWDVTDRNNVAAQDNGAAAQIGPIMAGYASVSSGTLDWDFDVAEQADISPTYNCDEQIAVVFSLALAGGQTYSLSAAAAAASSTPGTVDVNVLRAMSAISAGASGTPVADLNVLREMAAAAVSASNTSVADLDVVTMMAAIVQAASATPAIPMNVLRAAAGLVNSITVTGDVGLAVLRSTAAGLDAGSNTSSVDLALLIAVGATLDSVSSTPSVVLDVLRSTAAILSAVSLTPSPSIVILREMAAMSQAVSTSPGVDLAVLRETVAILGAVSFAADDVDLTTAGVWEMAALIVAASVSPSVDMAVLREAQAASGVVSITPSPVLAVLREMAATQAALSITPDINLSISGLIELLAAISAVSATPNSVLGLILPSSGIAQAASNTPDSILGLLMPTAGSAAAVSSTPNASLDVALVLSAILAAASNTSAAQTGVLREMVAVSSAVSGTSAPQLSLFMLISALIWAQSFAADDVDLSTELAVLLRATFKGMWRSMVVLRR